MRQILRQIVAVLALVGITTGLVPSALAATSYTDVSAANKLAQAGIIVDYSSNTTGYRLNDRILRQEAVKVVAGALGGILENEASYTCTGMFSDIAKGTWVCRVAELSRNAGLVAPNPMFNPTRNLSRIEAVIFALRSAELMPAGEHSHDAIIGFAIDAGLLTSAAGFSPNAAATRGEFFRYVAKALDAAELPDICTIAPDLCGGTTPGTGGAVTVSVSSTNPAAGTLLSDDTTGVMQNAAPVLKLNFRNNGSAPVAVNTLRVTRGGITVDADINNLYLYDGMTKVAEMTSSANKVYTFNSSTGLFTIPANSNKEVWVGVNMATGISGNKTVSFSVASASDVVLSNSTSAGGSYPMSGNTFTIAAVTDMGYVNLTNTTTFPATIDPSDTSKELWRFTATANAQKMAVKRIVLTMVGTIAPGDVTDLELRVNGVQVGSTAQIGSDNKVVFDLSSAPYEILSGQAKVFVLEGKVIKGTGRAFKFTIRSTADFVTIDKNYNVETTPLNAAAALTVVDPDSSGDGTNINNGTLTVSRAQNSPNGNVVSGGLDIPLARFEYKANGEDIKVQYVRVTANEEISDFTLNDGKLYFNGAQVGTTDDSVADESANVFSLGNTVIIPAGTTGVFEYRANIEKDDGTDLAAEQTIVVSLGSGTTDAQGMTSLANVATSAATGNTLTVKSGTLSAAINSTFASRTSTNPTGVKGAVQVKVGSFVITGGSGEATRITQIVVGDDGGDVTEDFGDNFQNLVLKNSSGVSISNSVNSTLSGTAGADFTFNISPAIEIPAGGQLVVDAYADILTGAAGYTTAAPGLEFVSTSATGVTTGSDASYSTVFDLQNVYIATSGTLTATIDSDSPVATQYVMGATDQTVAKFKLAASSSEAQNVSKIIVAMDDGDATDDESAVYGSFTNYKLYNGATLVGSASSAAAAGTTSENLDGLITFNNLALTVPANGSVVLTVKADVSAYPDATSGTAVYFSIQYDTNTELATVITAQGAGSGANTSTDASSADQNSSAATVYRTKLTVAYASDSPSGSSSGGTGQVVAKYVVANSANAGNYDATLKLFGQTVSSTIALTAETTRDVKIYKDSVASGNLLATVTYDTQNTNTCSVSSTQACIDAGDSGDVTEDRFGATNADTTTGLTEARFVDVTIAAGSSKTIIVTADTLDAASSKNFSIQPISSGAATGVSWSDGITSSILTIDSLPLVPVKTLTY